MSTEKPIEITRIKLNLGGKDIELTVEQARKLKQSLDDLFGKETVREIHIHDTYRWFWYPATLPTYPVYPATWPVYPSYPYPTWGGTTAGIARGAAYGGTLQLNT